MKHLALLAFALAGVRATPTERSDSDPQGIDVSDWQGNVDWKSVAANGIKFAFVKATEGTSYISPYFGSQFSGAADAGIIRGAYHFAHPDSSTGAAQAKYLIDNGGGWTADGMTLPGALDIEYNPDGNECYDRTASEMVSWIKDFSDTYKACTGRYPVIYTTTGWWTSCTGNSAAFGSSNPLWIADWATHLGTLPAGWKKTTFWRYNDTGPNPGDADLLNGDCDDLKSMAFGYPV